MAEVTICFNEMLKRKLVRLSPSDLGQSQQGIRQDSWRLVEAAAKEEEYEETGEFVCETGFCSPGFSSWVPGVLLGVHGGRVGTYRTYPPAAASVRRSSAWSCVGRLAGFDAAALPAAILVALWPPAGAS